MDDSLYFYFFSILLFFCFTFYLLKFINAPNPTKPNSQNHNPIPQLQSKLQPFPWYIIDSETGEIIADKKGKIVKAKE